MHQIDLHVEKSTGNIFADLGFSEGEAHNLKLRSECMMALEAAGRKASPRWKG
jgi:predicted XRE-type DNA-binding protein